MKFEIKSTTAGVIFLMCSAQFASNDIAYAQNAVPPAPAAVPTAVPTQSPDASNVVAQPTLPPPMEAKPTAANTESARPIISDENEGPPKLSLPTEEDREAWTKAGFRLSIGLTYGRFKGLRGAPSGRLLGPLLRVGMRLDKSWSIMSTFEYSGASSASTAAEGYFIKGLSGLRFAGTIDPTWHPTRSLSIAIGFGFGGLLSQRYSGDPSPTGEEISSPYTFPNARRPLETCAGVGVSGLLRGEWMYVLGPRSAFSIAAQVMGQWTHCIGETGRLDDDTGQAIERYQYWPHIGSTLTAGFTWR
jgi:hypothetical protein